MKNIAELNLLKSNLIIHKLAACVLLTGFLLRLLLKQTKTHVATFLFHCCNCRDALMLFAAQRFLSPVVERPAATANPGTPVVETCMEFTGSTELLHCCQLCFKFYCLPQNVKNFKHIYWSDDLPKGFLMYFCLEMVEAKNKCIQFQYCRLPELLLRKVECQNYTQR